MLAWTTAGCPRYHCAEMSAMLRTSPTGRNGLRTSRQRREEPMHLFRVAVPARQAEEAVCHRPR